MTNLAHALAYAARGFAVFPLHTPDPAAPAGCSCYRPACKNAGKHPRYAKGVMEHGNKEATTDTARIATWWSYWPDANIGIRTGQDSGFFMLGPDGDQGIADLAALEAERGPLPETAVARSGGGGLHYLFRHPGWRVSNRANHRGTKIDVRGDGGLFVAAPSLHKSGSRYTWERDGEIAEAPAWVLEWIADEPRPPMPTRSFWTPTANIERRAMALLTKWVGPAVAGQRGHDTAFKGACALVLGYNLSPEDAYQLYAAWNETCNPQWSERELWHKLNDANKKGGPRGYLLRSDFDAGTNGHHVNLDSILSAGGTDMVVRDDGEIVEEGTADDLGDLDEEEGSSDPTDPGPMPEWILPAPGLIDDVVGHNLRSAIYQQPELAFAGALALMSVLTGRKITDKLGSRTNNYIFGLDISASGKEHARKVNKAICTAANALRFIGPERIGSHAGLISVVANQPAILLQLDEVDFLFSAMKDVRSPHMTQVKPVLLTMFSSADSLWISDALADTDRIKNIDQPHVVIYGNAIPDKIWSALTTVAVNDGLLGRCLIFEGRGYVEMNENPVPRDRVPQEIIDRVKWWADFSPGGNLASINPVPAVLEMAPDAEERLRQHVKAIVTRRIGEDPIAATLWSRTGEKTRKLALLFACSRAAVGEIPSVTLEDVNRAVALSNWLTRKLIVNVHAHVSENEVEAKRKRVLRAIPPGKWLTMTQLYSRTRFLRACERKEIIEELVSVGDLVAKTEVTKGRNTTLLSRHQGQRKRALQRAVGEVGDGGTDGDRP